VRDNVLPIAKAQLAHAAGRDAEAVALMRPAIGMYRLGGSHTSRLRAERHSLHAIGQAAAGRPRVAKQISAAMGL
jgi:hypothetical protein